MKQCIIFYPFCLCIFVPFLEAVPMKETNCVFEYEFTKKEGGIPVNGILLPSKNNDYLCELPWVSQTLFTHVLPTVRDREAFRASDCSLQVIWFSVDCQNANVFFDRATQLCLVPNVRGFSCPYTGWRGQGGGSISDSVPCNNGAKKDANGNCVIPEN